MGDAYRAPSAGRAVVLGEALTDAVLFVAEYEDERYAFENGSWGRFGRDDDVCEIPVWEEVREERLSRVAGELWVADGTLWVRNLSRSHELGVLGETGAPMWLPARTSGDRGRACSVPVPHGRLCTPTAGSWSIETHRITRNAETGRLPQAKTSRLDPVPPGLLAVAAALCAPLLETPGAPSTYDEVAHRLDITPRQARRSVERLCAHYADYLARPRPGHELRTPTYAYLAHLLVNRGLIGVDDVTAACPSGPAAGQHAPA